MSSRASQVTLAHTLTNADKIITEYEKQIKNIPYEEKGVLFSELLFLLAATSSLEPKQVLESGRARGQSTYILGLCIPESKVISIERNSTSPDALVAESRLKNVTNVYTLYGDARVLLPALIELGDIVIIDGPKGFRAIRLALTLLRTGNASCVFVHDIYKSLPERRFIEQNISDAFFSDDEQFTERFSHLDKLCWDTINGNDLSGWQPYYFKGAKQQSYGPTLACIPYNQNCPYGRLLAKLVWEGCFARMRRSIRKKLSHR
ncbi:MAG: hypothetical protein ACYSSO_07465 [Planctomycetota bacterium]|jgi:predicted O-methyltransferase YrrM